MQPITIIGSGLAGYTLARELRKLDKSTPLRIITSDDGTYYSKPQLSSALTHHKTAPALAITSAEKMAIQLDAEIIHSALVTTIDPTHQSIQTKEKEFFYSSLVLAQGAEIIRPTFLGAAAEHAYSINNLADYIKFRNQIQNKKHLTILGTGLVGCEFANDLLNGGFQISMIALSTTPLDLLLPPELGKVLQQAFFEQGIQWHLQTTIEAVETHPHQLVLSLSNGITQTTDILISAIGLRPVLTLAKSAHLVTNRGIVVDQYLRTSESNIYALGDCAEVQGYVMFYVAPLVACARALAHTLTGQLTPVHYPPMPVILKTPACPIVVCPPPANISGKWQILGSYPDVKGLFYNDENILHGFALTGKTVMEKMELVKKLTPLF